MTKRSSDKNLGKSRGRKTQGSMQKIRGSVQDWQENSDSSARALRGVEERDYEEILREFITSPAVQYVAGGIATALLTKLVNNMADRYPEISNFISENIDTLEEKLADFRDNMGAGDSARH
jgi:hypothetical protein